MILLQDMTADPTGLFSWLIQQGPIVVILGIIVFSLWKKMQKTDQALQQYLAEDRPKMLEALERNTHAFEQFTETLKDIKDDIKHS